MGFLLIDFFCLATCYMSHHESWCVGSSFAVLTGVVRKVRANLGLSQTCWFAGDAWNGMSAVYLNGAQSTCGS